jgi:hypothetical protein
VESGPQYAFVRGAAAQEGVGRATFAAADALGGVDAAATAGVAGPKDDLRHRERARERRATADCRLVVAELGAPMRVLPPIVE